MIGLFLTELIMIVVAALAGFAAGWRLYALAGASRKDEAEREIEILRAALSEAQVRRARVS